VALSVGLTSLVKTLVIFHALDIWQSSFLQSANETIYTLTFFMIVAKEINNMNE